MARPYDSFDVFVGTRDDNAHMGEESTMYGFRGDDQLIATSLSPVTAFGGRGADKLYGQVGDDFLYGGRGNDTLFGKGGEDHLYGGKGHDTFVIDAGEEHTIMDFNPKKDFIIVLPDA